MEKTAGEEDGRGRGGSGGEDVSRRMGKCKESKCKRSIYIYINIYIT